MSTSTLIACPAWCTLQGNATHAAGEEFEFEEGGLFRVHARLLEEVPIAANAAAPSHVHDAVYVDVTANEVVHNGAPELDPLLVSLSQIEPMTPTECRTLAAALVRAADAVEAMQ